MKKGKCPVCSQTYTRKNPMSFHHLLPKRFFNGEGPKKELCRLCHNILELIIPEKTKLSEYEYERMFYTFVRWRKGELR